MTTAALPLSTLALDFFKEEDISEETKSLVSTLPKKRGWISKNIYLFEGFWFSARHLQGVVASQTHFQALHSDIILVTGLKCGTTWLKAMVFALTNRSTALDSLLNNNPHTLIPTLEIGLFTNTCQLPDLSMTQSPRIFATHMPFGSLPRSAKDSSCKIVYLCRNPKDTLVSMWHFANKLRPKDEDTLELGEVVDEFCDGANPFGPFWDHVLGYWNESLKSPRKVLFLRYEDIKEQPSSQLRRLAEFLECPFSPKEQKEGMVDDITRLCSFDHLKNLEVNKSGTLLFGEPNEVFFRKGKVGDSVNYLTSEMTKKIDDVSEVKLINSGFKF